MIQYQIQKPKLVASLFFKLYNCYSHSIETTLFIDQLDSGCFKIFLNNLITNEFDVWNYVRYNAERCITALFDLLTTGRKQFKNISYYQLDPRLYNRIIEHIETSKNFSKMIRKIKLDLVTGSFKYK
uniref:Uncharacterized protein n=1 Tax=Meloidogyne enterolobii TaxID=390850 RepID=A0A6V7XYU7_MELEN|nr:unnamed protein product [Meloidogyne enterolobii]